MFDRRAVAEAVGTFWLVFGGCGAAVLAGDAIGVQGIALAFGLTVMTMVYAIGHISGCHLNPAVSVGLVVAKRFEARDLAPYIIAQLAGSIVAIAVLFAIVKNGSSFDDGKAHFLASNGFGDFGPGAPKVTYDLAAAFIAETVLTFMFLMIILGATDKRAPAGFAGIAIGLGLTLIHLIGIPITNLSVNPARSTAPALFEMGDAIKQLWLFWVAPMLGAGLAGLVYPAIAGNRD